MKDRMKVEAITRMKKLELDPEVIDAFEQKEEVQVSMRELGMVHKLPVPYGWERLINKWQNETDCIVYHAIYSETSLGEMLYVLYVPWCEEEWEMDWKQINECRPPAYAFNLTTPVFSEYGSIPVEKVNGGLIEKF